MREFEEAGKSGKESLFGELCFCLMTANFNAERAIKIQDEVGDGFLTYNSGKMAGELKRLGHRYPNARAGYIIDARKHADALEKTCGCFETERELRDWIVQNVTGLGMKEASHFMRNIGFTDVAIIDFHIIDLLEREGLAERPKTVTKNRYLEIEDVLRRIGRQAGMNLAELDLYLWYIETGKILK